MGYPVSRQQIRLRVLRDSHRQGDSGAVSFPTINEHVQDVYNELWATWAHNSKSSIGKSFRVIPIASDSPTMDIPDEAMQMSGWSRLTTAGKRASLPPQLVRPETALHNGWLDDATGTPCYPQQRDAYYLEGPGQTFDVGLDELVPHGLRLRAFPPFHEGESVTLLFKTQPQDLGDPDVIDTGPDLVPIELLTPTNLRAMVALVRVRAAARGDASEETRAVQELAVSANASIEALGDEDASGTMPADLFQDSTLPTAGYGGGGGRGTGSGW